MCGLRTFLHFYIKTLPMPCLFYHVIKSLPHHTISRVNDQSHAVNLQTAFN